MTNSNLIDEKGVLEKIYLFIYLFVFLYKKWIM